MWESRSITPTYVVTLICPTNVLQAVTVVLYNSFFFLNSIKKYTLVHNHITFAAVDWKATEETAMLLELGIHWDPDDAGAGPLCRNKKVKLAGGQPLLVAGGGTAFHISQDDF